MIRVSSSLWLRFGCTATALLLAACSGNEPSDKDTGETFDTDTDPDDDVPDAPSVQIGPEEARTADDLVATIQNPDESVTYTYAWSVDGAARPEITGDTVAADLTTKGESWRVEVIASRGGVSSDPGVASINVANTPPSGTIVITPELPNTLTPLTATPDAEDDDGDTVTWTWTWHRDNTLTALTGPTVPALSARKGQVWRVTGTPHDGEEPGAGVTAEITIGNAPPTVASCSLSPSIVYTNTSVTANISSSDADNDPTQNQIEWLVDGATVAGVTGPTLDGSHFQRDQVIRARVVAYDGALSSDPPLECLPVTVRNSPPTLASVTLAPTDANRNATLTCTATGFADPDNDPAAYTYTWTRARPPGAPAVLVGETQNTLTGQFQRGDSISCSASASDGSISSAALVSNSVVIRNSLPVVGGVTFSPANPSPEEDITATATNVVDADGDPVDLVYRWHINNQPGPSGATLDADFYVAGDLLFVEIVPEDPIGEGPTFTSDTIAVANRVPIARSVEIRPPTANVGSTLRAFLDAYDPDNHPVSSTYRWFVGTAMVQEGPSDVLAPGHHVRGDVITVEATPRDPYGAGSPILSAALTIGNAPPSADGASVSPNPAFETSTLTCDAVNFRDADGDAAQNTVVWSVQVGAASPNTFTTPTLTGANFNKGNVVRCELRPGDGVDSGTARTSPPVTISNSPPTLSSASITPSEPSTRGTLTAVTGTRADADGDSVTLRYRWFLNGNDTNVTSASYSSPSWVPGDEVFLRVTPFDGFLEGEPIDTTLVVLSNRAPVIAEAVLTPTSPTTQQDVRVVWSATDPDGDSFNATFRWFVNNQQVPGVSADTLPAAHLVRGAAVTATVTVTDVFNNAASTTTAGVTVGNAPPTVTGAVISPTNPRRGDALTCTPIGLSDPDGDAVDAIYTWRVAGEPVSDQPMLPPNSSLAGHAVTCSVRARDALNALSVATVTSLPVTILNTPPTLATVQITPQHATETSTFTVAHTGLADADPDQAADVIVTRRWYVNDIPVDGTPGSGTTLTTQHFRRDDRVYAILTPFDGRENGVGVQSNTVVVQNTAPVVQSAFLEPTNPVLGQDIEVFASATDIDHDITQLSYVWYVNDVVVPNQTGTTLPGSLLQRGSRVYVAVTAYDMTSYSAPPYNSGTVIVGNTPPTATSATITPTDIYETTVASCQGGGFADVDGDPEHFEYEWRIGQRVGPATRTIDGSHFAKGEVLTCIAKPYDGTAYGPPVTSAPITVRNSAPTIGVATLTQTAPREDSPPLGVALSTYGDPDPQPPESLTLSYRWFRRRAGTTTQVATSATITGSVYNKGDDLWVEVTVTDGSGVTATTTSNTVTVVNAPPQIVGLALSPTAPTKADTIQATHTSATDADGDPVTIRYAWYIATPGGPFGDIPGVTGASLAPSFFSKNRQIRVTATPNDGTVDGTPVTSTPVTSINTPPVLQGTISFSPATIRRSDTVATCTATLPFDLDGDNVLISYYWSVNGSERSQSPTIAGNTVLRNDVLRCRATANDGEADSNTLVSGTTTVANSLPTIATVTLSTAEPRRGQPITATVSPPVDADPGDAPTFTVAWLVNGAQVATGSTLSGDLFYRGNTIQARAVANDTIDNGPPTLSAQVTVVNSAPVQAATPTLNPAAVVETTTVGVALPSVSDPDGDTNFTWRYEWRVGTSNPPTTVVQTGAGATLTGSLFNKNDYISVTTYVTDGTTESTGRVSPVVQVGNTVPTAGTIVITPTQPRNADNLTCTLTVPGTDPDPADQAGLRHEVRWRELQSPSPYPTSTNGTATINASMTNTGETWICETRTCEAGPNGCPNGWTTRSVVIAASTQGSDSCASLWMQGERADGLHLLTDGAATDALAWCDQTTAGGGWTRVMRTTGSELWVGQDTHAIVDQVVSANAEDGVYEAASRVRGFAEVMLKATDGPQAGRYAVFTTLRDPGPVSLADILRTCRDEALGVGDDTRFDRPRTLGHTSYGSAVRTDGSLTIADRWGGEHEADWFFFCGVNETGDNDVSYLAVTADNGQNNAWDTRWYGASQPGTLWSFASGPYGVGVTGHLGTPWMVGLAGYKADGPLAEAWHAGTWELFVR